MQPSAIASSPDGGTIYVTDTTSNTLLVYSASGGLLTPIAGSPFATGNAPSAVVVDATGSFVYVANSVDSTLTGFSTSGGAVNAIGTYSTGTQPLAIGIDPSLNQYLYTANFLGNTVSGFQISATSGSLLNSQFSPYPSNANPTAVAAIPHKVSR
jgi:DNA-binding beta-propeller fold protein YncE